MATATSCSTTATTTAPVASGSQSGDDHHRHHAADLSAVARLFRHDRPGGHLRLPGFGAVRPPLMAAAQTDQDEQWAVNDHAAGASNRRSTTADRPREARQERPT